MEKVKQTSHEVCLHGIHAILKRKLVNYKQILKWNILCSWQQNILSLVTFKWTHLKSDVFNLFKCEKWQDIIILLRSVKKESNFPFYVKSLTSEKLIFHKNVRIIDSELYIIIAVIFISVLLKDFDTKQDVIGTTLSLNLLLLL